MALQDGDIVMVQTIIRAYNKDGYHLDILSVSDRQCHMHENRVKETARGYAIDPADFPEMVKFEVIVKNHYR